jgi:glycosyltransferase involved in cell wall biosynthesis
MRRVAEADLKMRVLHVSSSIDPISGGTAVATCGMARAQAAAGIDVRVVATWVSSPGTEAKAQLEKDGIAVRSIQATNPISRAPGLREIVDEMARDVDVIHIHAMWEQIQHDAARVAQARGIPYVMTPHGMLDPWNMNNGRLKKRLYLALRMRRNLNRASLLHFATEIEREWTARLGLRAPAMVEPFGVDLREFETLPPREVSSAKTILFLGRLHEGKGLEVLIPALAAMRRDDVRLMIVGPDSGYQARAKAEIARLKLSDRVTFTGMLLGPERMKALVNANLLVLPSFHENFGIAVVEALAAGTPVVVSDQVGLHRMISSAGVGGVAPLEPAALAKEIERWLEMRSSERAREFVWENFDWTKIGRRWVEHYRGLLRR